VDLSCGGERVSDHVPFRGSKLTQVLRDAFIDGALYKLNPPDP
jgi:hypothetical protein